MSLEPYPRHAMIHPDGVRYQDYAKTLTPHYARVWSEIALGFVALGLILSATVYSDRHYDWRWMPLTVAIAAPLIGYVVHYITLFFHEAAHFNIARQRRTNDRLANLFIGSLVGQSIKNYRVTHLMHHQYLGLPNDPERSYFEPLSGRTILESLTGIRVLKIILHRRKINQSRASASVVGAKKAIDPWTLVALTLHASIVGGALFEGCWSLAISWAAGIAVFFPFFGALRQLLEHRSETAERSVDYSQVPHGETHRLFGTGPFSSTFGAAGFNRHLLHHWDMRISYTRFREMEKFLHQTAMSPALEKSTTRYGRIFSQLFASHSFSKNLSQ